MNLTTFIAGGFHEASGGFIDYQASGGFHEEDGKVIRVRGEIPEDGPIPCYLACGPNLLDPGDASSWEDRVAVGIEHKSGKVGGRGGIADGHINIPPVG